MYLLLKYASVYEFKVMRLKTQKFRPIGRYAIEMFKHSDHAKSIVPPFLPTSMSS